MGGCQINEKSLYFEGGEGLAHVLAPVAAVFISEIV